MKRTARADRPSRKHTYIGSSIVHLPHPRKFRGPTRAMNPLLIIVLWCLFNSLLGSVASAVCNTTGTGTTACKGTQIASGVICCVTLVACVVALALGGGRAAPAG